ncbi:unnamed protein product [Nyctereutes procyonoides]|uniref:(raccoon dog) hypothetical protein n=1 Tax=Nyctereutes procyonoides TaxID=34880 RepID=A0A811XTX4_NYCPR|nr:unnamed protein product [Nyctereutes procyonoides]
MCKKPPAHETAERTGGKSHGSSLPNTPVCCALCEALYLSWLVNPYNSPMKWTLFQLLFFYR